MSESPAWTWFWVRTSTSLTSRKLIMSCPKLSCLTTQSSLLTLISNGRDSKTDWSKLGNTDCRSRFVENFLKSREESQDFSNAVRYASNALPIKKRRSSHHWFDKPELDYARRLVQSCTDKYGVSCRQYSDAIANLEALPASSAAKTASDIIDEIVSHTEQCKPAAAWRAIKRLIGRKFKPFNNLCASSIATVNDN